NAHAWPLKIQLAGTLAVRSEDSTIYFSGYEPWTNGYPNFCYEKVNWKAGEAHRVQSTPAGTSLYATPEALPKGFAGIGYTRGIALYDGTTRRPLPMPATNGWANRQVYFVPTLGLMECYGGVNRQLTDGNLSIINEQPVLFSNTNISTGISVRMINERP